MLFQSKKTEVISLNDESFHFEKIYASDVEEKSEQRDPSENNRVKVEVEVEQVDNNNEDDSDVTDVGLEELFEAIKNDEIDTVETMLDDKPDILNVLYGDVTPLLSAIQENKSSISLMLLERGADIHVVVKGWNALHHAIYWRMREVAIELIDKGIDIQLTNHVCSINT